MFESIVRKKSQILENFDMIIADSVMIYWLFGYMPFLFEFISCACIK